MTRTGGTRRVAGYCTQCRSRCGAVAVVADGRLTAVEPLPSHPSGSRLCPKGQAAPELVYHPDRLLTPLRRTAPKGAADPGWQPIGWAEALDEVAGRMAEVRDAVGPEGVAFSVTTPSGSHLSDSIAWIERLIRAFGSPNTIYATEICNWHKDFASRFTFGHDLGTPDFAGTDCILLWGHNPTATWLARDVEIRKGLRRGAKLVVVDPRPTPFARRADAWLAVRPGTDQALALGLAHVLLRDDRFDAAFVRQWTSGPLLVRSDSGRFLREADLTAGGRGNILSAVSADGALLPYDATVGRFTNTGPVKAVLDGTLTAETTDGPVWCQTAFALYRAAVADWPPERVAAVTGVDATDIETAAAVLGAAPTVAWYAWNGIGQSTTATQTDRAVSLLNTLLGSYGRAGGNVPGGVAPFGDISGQELLTAEQRAKALGADERPLGPPGQGWVTARDVWRAILTKRPYPVRMLVSFGTNLMVSQPDPDLARDALAALDFHVHVDFFENATARNADILLPAATSWEREGLRTGFDANLEGLRRVQLRQPMIAPLGEARSDTDIAVSLAVRLGLSDVFFGGDVDRGHDAVLAPAGLDVGMLRAEPEGIDLPGTVTLDAHEQPGPDGSPRGFPTPTRRIEIYSEVLHAAGIAPVPTLVPDELPAAPADQWPLRLASAKTVAFCHSQHRNVPSLRKLMPEPEIQIAPDTAAARGIAAGDLVRMKSATGSALARARIVPGLAPDTVLAQHGWWVADAIEDVDGLPALTEADALPANINRLVDTSRSDPVSGSIALRCTFCEVEPVGPATAVLQDPSAAA